MVVLNQVGAMVEPNETLNLNGTMSEWPVVLVSMRDYVPIVSHGRGMEETH
jgi:hypothetical protein